MEIVLFGSSSFR